MACLSAREEDEEVGKGTENRNSSQNERYFVLHGNESAHDERSFMSFSGIFEPARVFAKIV